MTTDEQLDRSAALRKAYASATARLRAENREQFEKFYGEEAAALGVEYTPRLTAEQRAEREFEELLEQFPHLRDKVRDDS